MIVKIRTRHRKDVQHTGITKVHQVKGSDFVRVVGECRCCGRAFAYRFGKPEFWSVEEEAIEQKVWEQGEHTCEHEEKPTRDYDRVGHELLAWAENRRAKGLDTALLRQGADACFQHAALIRSLKRMTKEEVNNGEEPTAIRR